MKELSDISWQVSEEEYRADSALSYSTLSTYEREGKFDKIPTLFEKKESPSLLLGSAVDTLITGSVMEFEKQFLVADYECPDSIVSIVNTLFRCYRSQYGVMEDIPSNVIIDLTEQLKYQLNWKPETRVKVIKEKGGDYYSLLFLARDRKTIDSELYTTILQMVDALKTAKSTKFLFAADSAFEPEVQRYYQLKFKAELDGVPYRIMMDECIVLHDKKIIVPIDLKTSGKPEHNFFKSFLEWRYDLQAKLYTAVLKKNIEKDDYFKDFKINPYIFAVVNKKTLNPLCWEFKESLNMDDFKVGDTVLRNPLTIGKELYGYLKQPSPVPEGILLDAPNDIVKWLNKK